MSNSTGLGWLIRPSYPTRHRRTLATRATTNGVANQVANVAHAVHTRTDVPDAVRAANGVTRCPHCRHELAVVVAVIPADAAHVPTPEVIT